MRLLTYEKYYKQTFLSVFHETLCQQDEIWPGCTIHICFHFQTNRGSIEGCQQVQHNTRNIQYVHVRRVKNICTKILLQTVNVHSFTSRLFETRIRLLEKSWNVYMSTSVCIFSAKSFKMLMKHGLSSGFVYVSHCLITELVGLSFPQLDECTKASALVKGLQCELINS